MSARRRTERQVHREDVMGTTVSIDVRGPDDSREAIDDACSWLHAVDARFSTYRPASEIAQIARGELRVGDASAEVRSVLRRCDELRSETRGAFDARVSGSLDPSGYVKGWAAERAGRILERHGLTDFQINAGGDIVLRGGARPGEGWLIGLHHPDRRDAFADVALLRGGAITTSGDYERGGHVRDPRTGAPASGLRSVTVTAPDLGIADAWATAIFAHGEEGMELLADAPEGLEAFVIRDSSTVVQTGGFPSISKIPSVPRARA